MKMFTFFFFILSFFLSCSDNSLNSEDTYLSVTMDEIYQNKISNYVDSLINLKTKIFWENSNIIIGAPNDSLYADLLRLKFENADDYVADQRFKNQHRGDLFIVSEFISTKWDSLIEKYYFNDDSLSNNNQTYVFKGKIQFREWQNIKEEYWQDSTYINQWNNVAYWSQTFEFQIDQIIDKL